MATSWEHREDSKVLNSALRLTKGFPTSNVSIYLNIKEIYEMWPRQATVAVQTDFK